MTGPGFDLKTLQRWMHGTLIDPNADVGAADGVLLPNRRLTASERLSIYQRSYALRIAACMREQYPALCQALGQDLFDAFVAEYVRVCPPESYTLYDLGRRFADYLEDARPDRAAKTPEVWFDLMVDLARFERQIFVTLDGPGAPDDALADEATPLRRLVLNPSLSVCTYRFDLGPYYHQLREAGSGLVAPPHPSPANYAVLRRRGRTLTIPVSDAAAKMLLTALEGEPVAQAIGEDRSGPDIKLWSEMGAFCDAANMRCPGFE